MSSPRPSKRQRIGRACAPCRRRKSKCDGQQPECTICRSAGRFCSYEDSGRRRGLQSGYVRSLEAALGLVLQHVPRSEETVRRILRSRQRQGHLTNDAVDDCATVWRESKMARDVSNSLMPSSKGDERNHEADDGPEWEVIPLEPMEEPNEEAMGSDKELECSGPLTSMPNCSPQTPLVVATEQKDSLEGPFPENTADLLDTYFTHVHSWFPILERCDLLRVMHTTGHQNDPSEADTGFRLTIWAIVAYVSANQRDSGQQDPSPAQIQHCIQSRAVADSNVHDLGHVQALLVLSLLYIGQGELGRVWILVAHATRMLVMLHTSTRTHRYKHTFHACIILDNLVSTLLDRTPCLSLHEQTEQGPVGENGLEEWDMWTVLPATGPKCPLRALSTFNTIHQLMLELTRVLHSPLGERYMRDTLGDLHHWREKLASSHPYNKDCQSNPPLLILHLSLAFAMSSTIIKFSPMDSHIASLGINTVRSTLDMLDDYIQTTKTFDYFPLLPVFALQAQQCLQVSGASALRKDMDTLGNRLEAYLGTSKEKLGRIMLGSSTVPTDAQHDTYISNTHDNEERMNEALDISTQQAPFDLPSTAAFPDACTVYALQPGQRHLQCIRPRR